MGNFQGGARSANLGGTGGAPPGFFFSNMAPNKSIFRLFWGGAGLARGGGARPFWDARGGAPIKQWMRSNNTVEETEYDQISTYVWEWNRKRLNPIVYIEL